MAKKKQPAAVPDTSDQQDLQWYSYDSIMAIDAVYRVIIGMRSNGKTYGWARMALTHYVQDGLPSAYVRRLDEMIKPKVISGLFDPHKPYIEEITKGQYNDIEYRSNGWYFIRKEQNAAGDWERVARDRAPFCRSYAISTVETTKGPDYGPVWSICFDEFITRQFYLANELVLQQNLFSSIIRDRPGIQIFMLANTVSKSCPYFAEMGLYRIRRQEQGTIDVYQMGKVGTKIAVEYCATIEHVRKQVSKYFCFDNPQLDLITQGSWEIALYRHAPNNLSQYPVMLSVYIVHEDLTIQGDVYMYQGYPILFWHFKTTDIKDPEHTIIYCLDVVDGNPLHQREIKVSFCRAQTLIFDLVRTQKTFYATNEVGEGVAAYLKTQKLAAR